MGNEYGFDVRIQPFEFGYQAMSNMHILEKDTFLTSEVDEYFLRIIKNKTGRIVFYGCLTSSIIANAQGSSETVTFDPFCFKIPVLGSISDLFSDVFMA